MFFSVLLLAIIGSRTVPSIQCSSTLPPAMLSTRPPARPAETTTREDRRTVRSATSAKRHTYAKFMRRLRDHVRCNAIEPKRPQSQSEESEADKEGSDEALARPSF